MLEVLPATRDDVLSFYGKLPDRVSYVTKWVEDGEIIAMAGYSLVNGHNVVFSDIKGGAKAPKIRVWKEAVRFMSKLTNGVCVAENSSEFLERLGWKKTEVEGIYSWRA